MLQQTRVVAVIPYYHRFLKRFPDVRTLAAAPENDLLACWSGLGYYSRARNLQKAAKEIVDRGAFPNTFDDILNLPGIGPYTAAAVASIAFDLAHAAVDGNVRRVFSRLTNDANINAQMVADKLLDRKAPGEWNQAVMELGAVVCLPRNPNCDSCPLRKYCAAYKAGTMEQLPPKKIKPETERLNRTLLIIRHSGRLLLAPAQRVNGFWELPEKLPAAKAGARLGEFAHSITFRRYRFEVFEASTQAAPQDHRWVEEADLSQLPLSTVAKKALKLLSE